MDGLSFDQIRPMLPQKTNNIHSFAIAIAIANLQGFIHNFLQLLLVLLAIETKMFEIQIKYFGLQMVQCYGLI